VNKKIYIKPVVNKLILDYTISLQMQSQPKDPPPRGRKPKGDNAGTFESPFSDSPFN
jgi:hypothetical protein